MESDSAAMYTLLLTFKGETGGCSGGGRCSVRSSSSGADRPESFRRGGSAGLEGGCRGAGKGGARDVEKLRRRFAVASPLVVPLGPTGGQARLRNVFRCTTFMDVYFHHCGIRTTITQFNTFECTNLIAYLSITVKSQRKTDESINLGILPYFF